MSLYNDGVNLAEVTLDALVSLLQLKGYDLDTLLLEYQNNILDNTISAASPTYKFPSIDILKSKIEQAKENPLLNK